MITNIKQTLLGYDKNEFMPIYREGKLDNLDDFIAYKIKKAFMPTLVKVDHVFTDH